MGWKKRIAISFNTAHKFHFTGKLPEISLIFLGVSERGCGDLQCLAEARVNSFFILLFKSPFFPPPSAPPIFSSFSPSPLPTRRRCGVDEAITHAGTVTQRHLKQIIKVMQEVRGSLRGTSGAPRRTVCWETLRGCERDLARLQCMFFLLLLDFVSKRKVGSLQFLVCQRLEYFNDYEG